MGIDSFRVNMPCFSLSGPTGHWLLVDLFYSQFICISNIRNNTIQISTLSICFYFLKKTNHRIGIFHYVLFQEYCVFKRERASYSSFRQCCPLTWLGRQSSVQLSDTLTMRLMVSTLFESIGHACSFSLSGPTGCWWTYFTHNSFVLVIYGITDFEFRHYRFVFIFLKKKS
jgi:hypothetical protein